MLQVLGHSHLTHELNRTSDVQQRIEMGGGNTYLVLVPVHTREGSNVSKDVLQRISELERVHITKAELNMRINHELRQAKNLSA